MDSKTIVCCVVALLLGMLLANMLKSVCGCKTIEGKGYNPPPKIDAWAAAPIRSVDRGGA